jgi:hypothetical protein
MHRVICYLALTIAFSANAMVEILPKGRLFRLAVADPREIKMQIAFEGGSKLSASIGNYFSLLSYQPGDEDSLVFHWGIEGAGFFGLTQKDSRFPLETTDGLIGTYLESEKDNLRLQLRYTHVSSHLADGSEGIPIAYSRESLLLRAGYLLNDSLYFYGGLGRIMNSIPVTPSLFAQWGGDFYFPVKFLTPYLAADFKWSEEASQNPSLCVQLGLALNKPGEAYRSFRVFYSYFTGQDYRGQFFQRSLTLHSVGIEMQI